MKNLSQPRPMKRPASLVNNAAHFLTRMKKAQNNRRSSRAINRDEAGSLTRQFRAFGFPSDDMGVA